MKSSDFDHKLLDSVYVMWYFFYRSGKEYGMLRKATKKEDFQKNIKLYYSAVGVIILGYVFLAIGGANSITSLTIGPIVLVIGYLIAMPVALLTGIGKKEDATGSESDTTPPAAPLRKGNS